MRQVKVIQKEERCSEPRVYDESDWRSSQCSRRGPITEDGKLWCFQHAPSAVRKRTTESDARFKADQDRRLAPYNEAKRLRAVNAKLLEALGWIITHADNADVDAERLALDAIGNKARAAMHFEEARK